MLNFYKNLSTGSSFRGEKHTNKKKTLKYEEARKVRDEKVWSMGTDDFDGGRRSAFAVPQKVDRHINHMLPRSIKKKKKVHNKGLCHR